MRIVFHCALVAMTAIEVHETIAALNTGGTAIVPFYHVEVFLIVVPCVVAVAWLGMI